MDSLHSLDAERLHQWALQNIRKENGDYHYDVVSALLRNYPDRCDSLRVELLKNFTDQTVKILMLKDLQRYTKAKSSPVDALIAIYPEVHDEFGVNDKLMHLMAIGNQEREVVEDFLISLLRSRSEDGGSR